MDTKSIYESHDDSSEDYRRSGKATLQNGDTRPESMNLSSIHAPNDLNEILMIKCLCSYV